MEVTLNPTAYYVPGHGYYLPKQDKSNAKDTAFDKVKHLAVPLYTITQCQDKWRMAVVFYAKGLGCFYANATEIPDYLLENNLTELLYSVSK